MSEDLKKTSVSEKKDTIIIEKTPNEHYVPHNTFATSKVNLIWQTYGTSNAAYTNEQIEAFLKDPIKNHAHLKKVSDYLWATSPLYQNYLYYLSTIISFDYIMYPEKQTAKKEAALASFTKAAKIVKNIGVKSVFPMMLLQTLKNGSAFWYDLSDTSNTIIQEIDNSICQLAFIDDDNLWRYFVDLSKIKGEAAAYVLPAEIQEAYMKWVKDGKSKAKNKRELEGAIEANIPDSFYLVSKKGFTTMAHMRQLPQDYPYFASMFTDFNTHEDNKEFLNDTLRAEAVKIIHLKVPTDKDGIPLMTKELVSIYHESAKEHLPDNVAPLTNPFDVEGITTDTAQRTQINLVENSGKIVQQSSGISETLFNAATTNGLSMAITSDAARVYPFLKYFNDFSNFKIQSTKHHIEFLQVNLYDRMDWHKQYATDLASGGSRMLFLSTSGVDIYDTLNMVRFENTIDIDSLLPAKMNANQMSGDEETGRPGIPNKEKAPSTENVDGHK